MRIERVDDKTVKCFLSNEELEEYDIDYKDFVLRSERAKEVVQDIMMQASEEVGYKPPKFAFDLQIMMLPDQGLLLTFSEKEPFDIENNAQLLQCLKEMKEIVQKAKGTASEENVQGESVSEKRQAKEAAPKEVLERQKTAKKTEEQEKRPDFAIFYFENIRNIIELANALPGSLAAPKEVLERQKTAKKTEEQEKRPDFAIFYFENIRNIIELANALPGSLRVQSALYEMQDGYYLHLQKGAASYERYSRACIQAMEFGSLYTAEKETVLYLEEHGQCLIKEKALKKLRLN